MINIEQNQKITENENLRVASPSGSYEDSALIEFYNEENPNVILGAFAAQYIKYGGIVYRFNDPKELGAEILKIDAESTHAAASLVRMQNELSKQFDQGSLESNSLDTVMETEQANMEDQSNSIIQNDTNNGFIDSNNISSTTPAIVPDSSQNDMSTSTPEIISPENSSTSTPEIIDSESLNTDATSTAEEIISYAKKQIKKKITKRIKNKILG